VSRYSKWAQREQSEATRIRTTLLAGPVFLGLLPFLVAGVGPRLDRRLGLPPVGIGREHRILGGLLTVLGFSLGVWSVDTQLTRGRGTPLPVMPTQVLLTEGPLRHCRNPMTLGAILAYLGMAVAAGTTAGTALVLSLAASLLVYLKRLEEEELAERFGEAYLAYVARAWRGERNADSWSVAKAGPGDPPPGCLGPDSCQLIICRSARRSGSPSQAGP
jgi:protein-S-isoprenylcysteine O-methyltransferase Ste14